MSVNKNYVQEGFIVQPDVFTYPKDHNPHIPVQAHEGGTPLPLTPAESAGEVSGEHLFPIAETATLPEGFYEKTPSLDTRYARDRERAESLARLQTLIEFEPDSEAVATMRTAYTHFATSLIEGDYLKLAFESGGLAEQSLNGDLSDGYKKFLHEFDVDSVSEAQSLNALLYAVPRDIRHLAFEDLGTCWEVLTALDELDLPSVSNSLAVIAILEAAKFSTASGEARVSLIKELRTDLVEQVVVQRAEEDRVRYGADREEAERVIAAVSDRRREATDCVDGNSFGFFSNTGTIVDPSYLFSDRYPKLLTEPVVNLKGTWQTVLHMMGGTYTFGHDHTYLYRNRNAAIPNSYIGTPPDYGVIRPGNFVFHDLKYVEYSPIRKNYPLDYFFEYIIAHYLEQMDILTLDDPNKMPDYADAFITKKAEEGYFATPLEKVDHVLPFRALKKQPESDDYFEYGEACYLAELVDIAMQCDRIAEKARQTNTFKQTMLGETSLGEYTSKLLAKVWAQSYNAVATATLVEQVLFMQGGRLTAGAEALQQELTTRPTMAGFADLLRNLEVQPFSDEYGVPENPKPPLTCYYEWFTRFARPISREEMTQRGLPVRQKITFSKGGTHEL